MDVCVLCVRHHGVCVWPGRLPGSFLTRSPTSKADDDEWKRQGKDMQRAETS